MEIQILEQTKDYLVCVKPAGIAVQTRRVGEQDMESLLRNMFRGEIYVIHRLDQPVEGITLWALNQPAAAYLSRLVAQNKVSKKYLAYVRVNKDHPIPDEGELNDHILKDSRTNTSSIVSQKDPRGKAARLIFKVIRREPERALVEVELVTGRHHQIRLQFAHRGWPLIGDRKYGVEGDRLCLCAYRLEFTDKSGNNKQYEVKPTWL